MRHGWRNSSPLQAMHAQVSTQPLCVKPSHLACATAERCEAGVMVWKAARKSRRSTRTWQGEEGSRRQSVREGSELQGLQRGFWL